MNISPSDDFIGKSQINFDCGFSVSTEIGGRYFVSRITHFALGRGLLKTHVLQPFRLLRPRS
jgi:hypothetical protein